jgi:hypothetical protein
MLTTSGCWACTAGLLRLGAAIAALLGHMGLLSLGAARAALLTTTGC